MPTWKRAAHGANITEVPLIVLVKVEWDWQSLRLQFSAPGKAWVGLGFQFAVIYFE